MNTILTYFNECRADDIKEAINLFVQECASKELDTDEDLLYTDISGSDSLNVELILRESLYENGEYVIL